MRNAVIVIVAIIVVFFLFTRHSSTATTGQALVTGGSGTTTGHFKVVPTIRSVTVSPGEVTFGDCNGGNGDTNSVGSALGYPNGSCSVGLVGANESFPITVTYTGIPGKVLVSGSNAVPADNGAQWSLCNPNISTAGTSSSSTTAPSCAGSNGLPGMNQYTVTNFASGVAYANPLSTNASCDQEFDAVPTGGCTATPPELQSQVQHEGLVLTGPETWDDHSTSWTITVTWTAVGPAS
jgi:hypothetical protein